MSIDTSVIGRDLGSFEVDVERGRLRFFAQATGQDDSVYLDLEAARDAGHPDLPVPPTFLFCLAMDRPSSLLDDLGIDLRAVLHGEQAFDYHALAHAGDRLRFSRRVTDTYEKKGGALQFLVRSTEVTRDGEPIAQVTDTLVVRRLP